MHGYSEEYDQYHNDPDFPPELARAVAQGEMTREQAFCELVRFPKPTPSKPSLWESLKKVWRSTCT